jgi:hypothetical protein
MKRTPNEKGRQQEKHGCKDVCDHWAILSSISYRDSQLNRQQTEKGRELDHGIESY